ncbi:MAG: hypothetical protein EPN85_08260 [Bacteroidetes bacterium]|nr:MAG: hypothetical protein EPN85_08260 [Bacteroidota bacterium]
MQKQKRKKWEIIVIEVIASGDVKKIAYKLPANVERCKGFIFSGNVEGSSAKNYVLGRVSLFINNRKFQPLNYIVESKPLDFLRRKYETLKLEEEIEAGSYVQGYYEDLASAVSFPYKVRIYLDCTTNGADKKTNNG